jgi:hypothetical protein
MLETVQEHWRRRGLGEVIKDTIYGYEQLEPGVESLDFMQRPIGPSTLEDTNMVLPGSLPTGMEFLIEAVELAYLPSSDDQRAAKREYFRLGKSGRLELFILSKSYLNLAPLGFFMRPWITTATKAGSQVTLTEQAPWLHGTFNLGEARFYLLPLQQFAVRLSWQRGAPVKAPARLGVILHGLRWRRSE